MTGPATLGGNDVALAAASFTSALQSAGLRVTPEQSARFAQAIALTNPLATAELYWAARITLVSAHDQVGAFDRVFAHIFGGFADPSDTRGASTLPPPVRRAPTERHDGPNPPPDDRSAGSVTRSILGRSSTASGATPGRRRPVAAVASDQDHMSTTDFSELEPDELAELARLMARLRLSTPMRTGRRARRHHRGDRLDLRATLRRSRRSGGDPVVQVRRRRRPRPRRLVVLCDISGSMEPYARAYVQFLHAAAGASRAEVFTFATRLTRLTRVLAVRRPELALAGAAAAAPDWRGGTRIAEGLTAFLDTYGRRGLARGAVVVIVSDGWERADAAGIAEAMARLSRLAHRVVWVNPRRADVRYQPLAAGMAAALPYCDALVSGHSVAALSEVVDAIAGRRGGGY